MANNIQELIAERAAKELLDGEIINLGIGIPTLVSKYVANKNVFLHTENGMLGVEDVEEEPSIDKRRFAVLVDSQVRK